MQQEIIFSNAIAVSLRKILENTDTDRFFILTDTQSSRLCMPLLCELCKHFNILEITIGDTDVHKNIESLAKVWQSLGDNGASRKSVLINLGGGMITDLGGFAAASFKRGIRFFNIPTTLLGAVDASVGGKTGVNFNGLKNEVGVFAPAKSVLISTEFLSTLDEENIKSGYAEMLKHGLIDKASHYEALINYDFTDVDEDRMLELMRMSVALKEDVVTKDPFEKGIRKALNLGHTVGHAFESLAFQRGETLLHGYAVAWGLVCELILSHCQCNFPLEILKQTASFVKNNYGYMPFTCKEYDALYDFMKHDKKNEGDGINFTLLTNIGGIEINQTATKENIFTMFDIFRDLFE